ncbi:MAG: hypothetical protein RL490_2229, partial [Pseudomonadota bacterium]
MRGSSSLAIGVALLFATAPALAATPFEPLDLYRLSMVTDPQVSPDGGKVIFNRATFDLATDSRQGETWLATLNGKTVDKRLLIPASARASGADWSPDGSRIAYVAPVLGKPQLWVMDVAAGIGAPITTGKIGPRAFRWSPDGKSIAFVARVDAAPVKLAGMPDKPEGATWAPAAKIIDSFRYRFDGAGYGTAGADQLFVVAASGGEVRQLTRGDSDQISGGFDWTPDGQALVYSTRLRPGNERLPVESDLYRIAVSGGTPVRVSSIDGIEDDPQVSPDGRLIAFSGGPTATKFYNQTDLWVMPATGGSARKLTGALDRPIIAAKWAKDGKGLYAFYNDVGLTRVALVPLDGGKPRVVVNQIGGTRLFLPSSGGNWAEGGGTFAYTTVEADRPA